MSGMILFDIILRLHLQASLIERELTLLQKIRHPNIIHFITSYEVDDAMFVNMCMGLTKLT